MFHGHKAAQNGRYKDRRNTAAAQQGRVTENGLVAVHEFGDRETASRKSGPFRYDFYPGSAIVPDVGFCFEGEMAFERICDNTMRAAEGKRRKFMEYGLIETGAPQVFTALNGLSILTHPESPEQFAKRPQDERKAYARAQVDFRGFIQSTNKNAAPGLSMYSGGSSVPIQDGGVNTVLNTSDTDIGKGDYLIWDVQDVGKDGLSKSYPMGDKAIDGNHPEKRLFVLKSLDYDEFINVTSLKPFYSSIVEKLNSIGDLDYDTIDDEMYQKYTQQNPIISTFLEDAWPSFEGEYDRRDKIYTKRTFMKTLTKFVAHICSAVIAGTESHPWSGNNNWRDKWTEAYCESMKMWKYPHLKLIFNLKTALFPDKTIVNSFQNRTQEEANCQFHYEHALLELLQGFHRPVSEVNNRISARSLTAAVSGQAVDIYMGQGYAHR